MIHAPFRSPDPGLLQRALELALGHHFPGALPRGTGAGDPADMAQRLAEDPRVQARAAVADLPAIAEALAAGTSMLARTDEGWVVATERDLVALSSLGEHRERPTPRALRRRLGGEPREVLLLTPRLGLAPLGRRGHQKPSPARRLRALMGIERRELGALVIYAVVLGALSLAVPVAVQVMVNTIAFGSLLQPLAVLAILLLGVLAFGGTVQVMEWYAVEVLQRRIFVRVAEDLARRLPSVTQEARDRTDLRELSNRFFEVVSLQKSAGRLLLDGLTLGLQTAVGLALLAFYHPVLLAFDAVLLVALGLILLMGRGAVKTALGESRAKYQVAAWLQTIASNPVLFRNRAGAAFGATRADALTREYLRARRRHYRRVLRQLVGGVGLQILALVALLGLGGWLVMRGELTLGQLVAAELVVGMVGVGFAKLGKHMEAGYDLLASLEKLGKLLDLPDAGPPPPPASRAGPVDVELHQLGCRAGFSPVTRTIPAGARALVEGPGDGAASDLLEVLAGLRSPLAGHARVGGLHPARARTYLVRPSDLVEGTILDNLRVVEPDLDEVGATRVLDTVLLRERVDRLEHGVHTRLLGHGGPLSRSERARLSLARGLLARPDLLLVDGALDELGLPEAELHRVLDATLGPHAPWTALVISRARAIRSRCDGALALTREVPS